MTERDESGEKESGARGGGEVEEEISAAPPLFNLQRAANELPRLYSSRRDSIEKRFLSFILLEKKKKDNTRKTSRSSIHEKLEIHSQTGGIHFSPFS